ncbi:MAG: efflux RND transporter permease subunit [Planctomycetes bacterium]|nr:efflux RND transporter permease subunit [Planctomycetota bacterium]MBI3833410.1 efflux RND transporter permease subunit [Planctomycetota bacterium]
MLNAIIRFSLHNRVLVLAAAVLLAAYGLFTAMRLPTDVLPDLNRPTVSVLTEAPGLAPEEVETQVTFHLETALNGAVGVERVRSTSGLGLSVVYVEFAWGTDIRYDRQVVQERLNQVAEKLPPGVIPLMGPVSSIMGEIMLVGLRSEVLSPMDVRSLADWTLRPAFLSVAGIAQVTVMGGQVRQFQVLADPEKLRRFELTLSDLEEALKNANENSGGGFIIGGSQEFVVRNLGRVASVTDIETSLVATRTNEGVTRPILVRDVAIVREGGAPIKRGDGSMNAIPAVIMAIQKQPGADTRDLTGRIDAAIEQMRPTLPKDLVINADLFRQSHFIEAAIGNVEEALRDGSILVVIVLILFLMNVRTTLITLTALPISLLLTALTFKLLGQSINTMTLGGIAVAIGELVDDAVVDVENVFRRLRENRHLTNPRPAMDVVFDASSEIRNSIVYGTAVVLLVFLPLFALSGIEGRLFQPLAIAYIISILMSLVVSLTITPALAFYLLPNMKRMEHEKDGPVLRACKHFARRMYDVTMPRPWTVIGVALGFVALGVFLVTRLGSEFLPAFNEGTATINVIADPGISLAESDRLGAKAEELILSVPEVKSTGRRTGRAEQDEHAEGVHYSELDVDFWTEQEARESDKHVTVDGRMAPSAVRLKQVVLAEIRQKLETLSGVAIDVGQPISHRIDHLLSGVRAQIAVKITGQNLNALRSLADQVRAAMNGIKGVVDLQVEKQVLIPQVRIRVKREAAARVGFKPADLVRTLETALKGKVVSQVLDGLKSYDLVLLLDESIRNNIRKLNDVRIISPTGAVVLLSDVAGITETPGPNQISRENVQRRMVVSANVQGRDLGSTVAEIQKSLAMDLPAEKMPPGYFLSIGGQFEAQRSATRLLLLLGALSLVAMFALLYSHFRSVQMVVQVMLNIPFAFIGSTMALWLARENFSVASLVGFISLTGIASRNGILMITHYIHLMTHEGMEFGREMVVRGSQERVAPVLMTALTAGLALIPLVLAAGQPGKEILYPVALVVLGGLLTSTFLDFCITPTVFLHFGRKSSQRVVDEFRAAQGYMLTPGGSDGRVLPPATSRDKMEAIAAPVLGAGALG